MRDLRLSILSMSAFLVLVGLIVLIPDLSSNNNVSRGHFSVFIVTLKSKGSYLISELAEAYP